MGDVAISRSDTIQVDPGSASKADPRDGLRRPISDGQGHPRGHRRINVIHFSAIFSAAAAVCRCCSSSSPSSGGGANGSSSPSSGGEGDRGREAAAARWRLPDLVGATAHSHAFLRRSPAASKAAARRPRGGTLGLAGGHGRRRGAERPGDGRRGRRRRPPRHRPPHSGRIPALLPGKTLSSSSSEPVAAGVSPPGRA